MYIRYIASYHNSAGGKDETGIFRLADFVRDHTGIDDEEKAKLQELIEWFDNNLPVPDFYDKPEERREEDHTYFWFKTSAENFVSKMEELCAILEANGIELRRLREEAAPGEVVFEDYCQIAVRSKDNFARIK